MFLTTTSAKLEILLGATVTTNNIVFVADYIDITSSSFAPGVNAGSVSSSTPVTLLDSPSASTQRQVQDFIVYNADTVDTNIVVRYNDGTNTFNIFDGTLHTQETLQYIYDLGPVSNDRYAARKEGNSPVVFPEQPLHVPEYTVNYNSVNKSLTNNTLSATWVGKATKAYTTCDVAYQVNTAGVGITWAEIAIGTGPQTIQHNAHITVRGSTDVSAVVNSLGIKKTTVSLSNINPGDDLYVVYGALVVTTTPVFAAQAAELLSSGFNYTVSTLHRPSTDVNRVVEYAINTSTTANFAVTFA